MAVLLLCGAGSPGWAQDAGLNAGADAAGSAAAQAGAGAAATVPPGGYDRAATPSPIAASPSVLPPAGYNTGDTGSGSSVRTGDLGQQIAQSVLPAGAAAVPGPAWQVTPSVGITEELTDNVQANGSGVSGGGRRGDLISILQPGLAVTGDTQRLQVNLAYSPQIYLYARDGSQDRVAHDFNGRALATLLPQTLFLDLRGFGSEQALPGGLGPTALNTLSREQTSQDFSFSASPYLLHRFGTLGTGEIGYSLARTIENASGSIAANPFAPNPLVPNPAFPNPPPGVFGSVPPNQRTTTQNGHAAFVTGEDFGRYNGTALASVTRFDGTGVLSSARRDIFTVDNGYAITRTITVLAAAGYEDIRYAGTAPVRISDAIWDVGARLTPNADSTLTVRYGHHDGFDSLLVDGSLAPSARTRLYVRYSEGLTTNQEQLQNALATTDLDALGNPVDHGTGAPIYIASNFFGVQDTLQRLRRLSVSAAYVLARDTVTATVENDKARVLSFSGVPGSNNLGSNSGTFGSLTWLHLLSPRLTSTAFVQYGERSLTGPPTGSQDELTASAALSYALGPKLSSSLQYSYDQTTGSGLASVNGGTSHQNLLLLSVVKTF